MAEKLFLVDGTALYYRSFFAFMRNPLINSRGEDTSVTFGVLMTLLRIIEEEKPEYLILVFDTKEPTFRHKIYDEYKANRERMPQEMADQLPRLMQTLDAMNFNRVELPGYEADDIIGTLAKKFAGPELQVFIVSGDKDMAQLVDDNIFLYATGKSNQPAEVLGQPQVKEKMGVEAGQIIDFLALMGDSSDNIPGVPKVGKKTAAKLLGEYGNLEGVYDHIDEMKESAVKRNLIAHREDAELSQRLATIELEVPLDHQLENMRFRFWDGEEASELMSELEFRTLSRRVKKMPQMFAPGTANEGQPEPEQKVTYELVRDLDALREIAEQLKAQTEFVFDLETDSLDFLEAEIAGIAIAWQDTHAYYIPLCHPDLSLDKSAALKILSPIFSDQDIRKVGHNIKFDAQIMQQHGVPVNGIFFDTMLASYLLEPSGQHKLDKVSEKYLDHEMIHIQELIGSGKNQKKMTDLPATDVVNYAAEDADITLRLYHKMKPELSASGMDGLFYDVEMPLVKTLMHMEESGIKLDVDFVRQLSEQISGQLEDLVKGIYRTAGSEFNLNSPQQLGTVLFDTLEIHSALGLKRPPKTKTGQYATSEKILERYLEDPVVQKILDYRKLTKLKNTYLDILPQLVHPKTGRVHTSYNQSVAATGRLSSSNPNLQNIPIRTEIGRKMRRAFIAPDQQHVLLSLDYSQIELRIMAHLSGDPAMIESFRNDLDIHSATASRIFSIPLDEVTAEQRRKAKEINFGIIYGMSRFGLASRLHISVSEAEDFINDYFATYPGIADYMKRCIDQATLEGYVETMLHRRRYLPEIKSSNRQLREFAERTAINTPIQGSAADLIKKAMNEVYVMMQGKFPRTKMLLQVHDELVFEVLREELETFTDRVAEIMEHGFDLQVPLKVDSGFGPNWLEAH